MRAHLDHDRFIGVERAGRLVSKGFALDLRNRLFVEIHKPRFVVVLRTHDHQSGHILVPFLKAGGSLQLSSCEPRHPEPVRVVLNVFAVPAREYRQPLRQIEIGIVFHQRRLLPFCRSAFSQHGVGGG
jgi:hypothetical protein